MINLIRTSFFLTVLLFGFYAQAAPTLLQYWKWMDQISQVSDSQTINTSQGSLLVVMVGLSNAGTNVTVSSPGLSFQEDIAYNRYDVRIEMWSAANVSAGNHTITVSCSQSEYIRWGVAEFSGVASSNYAVDTATGYGTGSTISTGTVSVSDSDTLLVAFVRTDGDETAHGTIYPGSNFTLIWPFSANEPQQKIMAEYRVVGSSGTYPNGFTMDNGDGGGWVAGLVAYAPLLPSETDNDKVGISVNL
jgi:hypothetical protein